MHLRKIIFMFYKDYPKKPIVISFFFDFIMPITKPLIKPSIKQKYGHLTNFYK